MLIIIITIISIKLYISIYIQINLSIYLSVYPTICFLPFHIYLPIMSIYLFTDLPTYHIYKSIISTYLIICLLIYLPIYHIYLTNYPFTDPLYQQSIISSLQSLIDQVGADRIMFGTDNPFFPPLHHSNNNNNNNYQANNSSSTYNITNIDGSSSDSISSIDDNNIKWPSTQKVYQCIDELNNNMEHKKLILQTNAMKLFNL